MLHALTLACMQFYYLNLCHVACTYISLHAVLLACINFFKLSWSYLIFCLSSSQELRSACFLNACLWLLAKCSLGFLIKLYVIYHILSTIKQKRLRLTKKILMNYVFHIFLRYVSATGPCCPFYNCRGGRSTQCIGQGVGSHDDAFANPV